MTTSPDPGLPRKVLHFHAGDRLRKARVEAGLTLSQLGEQVNISDKTLAAWERSPTFSTLARFALGQIAATLHVDESWLRDGRPSSGGPDDDGGAAMSRCRRPQIVSFPSLSVQRSPERLLLRAS